MSINKILIKLVSVVSEFLGILTGHVNKGQLSPTPFYMNKDRSPQAEDSPYRHI